MNLKKLLIFLSSAFLFLACNQNKKEISEFQAFCQSTTASPSVGIFGGQALSPEAETARGTVFILQFVDSNLQKICSGSLIDQNIVLTAAHCVPDDSDTSKLFVSFSTKPTCQVDQQGFQKSFYQVDEIKRNSNYPMGGSKYDLALIRLSQKAPVESRPLKLMNRPTELDANSSIYVSGFGIATSDYNAEADQFIQLRYASISVIQNSDDQQKISKSNAESVLYFDQSHGQGACAGDSGGPTFLKQGNRLFVLGVNSAVDTLGRDDFSNQNLVTCKQGLRSVSVYAQRDWLATMYRQLINSDSLGNQFDQ